MDEQTFLLTPELITLLHNSYVRPELSDCEYGAAEIDGKRPYGNSDVEDDVLELLKWGEERKDEARDLHAKTPQALAVILSAKSFEPGSYFRSKESNWQWKLKASWSDLFA